MGIFKAFSVKVDPSGNVSLGVDVQPISGVADSGRLSDDLAALFEALGETARDLGTGVIVLIDELQEATPEDMAALNTAVHLTGQAEVPLPVAVLGALATLGGDGPAPVGDIAPGARQAADVGHLRRPRGGHRQGPCYAPERGLLAFTVPGMHEFILRQP